MMTYYIYSHFLRTHRSLTTTLSIYAMMTLVTKITLITWNVKWHEMLNDMKCQMTSRSNPWPSDTWYISNLYADTDARSMTPSRNTRSYTLRSVPSSPGRSFLAPKELYTWYCPMTIHHHHPLFEHTPVLNNNFEYWCRDDFVGCDLYED